MNTPTNIIYKAKKAATNEWVCGYYTYRAERTHYIHEAKTGCYYEIKPDTLCIGCAIDGKEYFAGDEFVWPEYGTTGIITFSENGFCVWFNTAPQSKRLLTDCAEYITITGNIHD